MKRAALAVTAFSAAILAIGVGAYAGGPGPGGIARERSGHSFVTNQNAIGFGQTMSMPTDGAWVYWCNLTTTSPGGCFKAPLGGGPMVTLFGLDAGSANVPYSTGFDGTFLYVVTNGQSGIGNGLYRVAIDGGIR